MVIEYSLAPELLNDEIHNTIKIFNNYTLNKKTDRQGRFTILDTSWFGSYAYSINEVDNGWKLSLEASKVGKKLSVEELHSKEELFLKNLDKVIKREILITPEIANTDVYKGARDRNGILGLLKVGVALFMILYGLKTCVSLSHY